ncbi:hypothetical protein PP749_gp041 [Rhizobium phage RHEph22]|uniref:Uncharacterized protein n=1 Tax=Rhizobium phage RHEph22 TaxID=2836135 RepID=A0AAE7VN82_9CAUD|nr:hypothetical protein PP749_gp041 [Rhizobium phage RHEph22]QXV74714.1 hypothetical protein [Rhizobium phage RHEph22]QXV74809.1 hypothetical protein [Rhizobium phage RHEph24]
MTVYKVCYNQTTTRIQLIPDIGSPAPGYTVLGSFDHEHNDALGYPESHVLFHHFRDILYDAGITDLQKIEVDDLVQVTIPPTLSLSSYQINEATPVGSNVAQIIVNNPKGVYSFQKIADPDDVFYISGGDVKLLNPLDYETATSHTLRIGAYIDDVLQFQNIFTISVLNAVEGTLGPTEIYRKVSDPAGTQVAIITGLDEGADELLTAILPNDGKLSIFGDRILIGSNHTSVSTRTITVYTSQGRTLQITDYVTGLAPMPVISPTVGSSNNSDPLSTVILDLPPMSQDEVRTYVPTTGPAFVISEGGSLIRGEELFSAGTYTGTLTQYNGEEVVETTVIINATDNPVVVVTSPPATTAVNPPHVAGFIYWVNHDLGGLKVIVKVNDVAETSFTTGFDGSFSYTLEDAIIPSTPYTVRVEVETFGVLSAETAFTVYDEDAETSAWANAVIARGYTPDLLLREQVDTMIQAMKAGGSWAKRDRIQIYCWPDERCGVELKTATNLVVQGSLTFTGDQGYTGNGTSGFIDVLPYSGSNLVQQDSVNLACFSLTAGSNSNYHVGNFNGSLKVRGRTTNNSGGSANTTTLLPSESYGANAPVDVAIQRAAADQQRLYINGASHATDSTTSSAVHNSTVTAFKNSGSYANCQLAAVRIGGALTNAEMLAEYNAIRTFLQARGAIA